MIYLSVNYIRDFDFSLLSNYRAGGAIMPSPDQYVGELNVTKDNIVFTFYERDSVDYHEDDYTFISGNTYHEYNMVIILESPHRSEYDEAMNPIGLAMGQTGDNLFEMFAQVLKNSRLRLVERKYNVILANAVQYQTSCGLSPIDRNLRDQNWKDIYFSHGGEQDLKKRIFSLKPRYTINLCTGGKSKEGLRQIVNQSLTSFGLKQGKHFTDGNHPSAWNYNGNTSAALIR